MKLLFTISTLLLLLSSHTFAQKQTNIWYYQNGEGLDFSNGNPTVLTNGSIPYCEGSAAISDTTGQLQFYTDGVTIWDQTHSPMPNGANLSGSNSSTQSAIIIPQPKHSDLYYIFTTDQACGPKGFRYTKVDMSLNSNKGDVMPNYKNVPLLPITFEKVAAVHHCNGEDIWVIAIDANTGDFYTWLVTAKGLCNCPIITQTGPVHTQGYACMKFSNNGKKLVVAESGGICGFSSIHTDLYTFDNNTGIPSFQQTIDTAIYNNSSSGGSFWGASFSPNNQILYLSTGFLRYNGSAGLAPGTAVVQYDLNASNIENSAVLLFVNTIPQNGCGAPTGSLQLGPDGRIYAGNACGMDVIEHPDSLGLACNYHYQAIPNTNGSGYGITNFIESYLGQGVSACDHIISDSMCNWIRQINCFTTSTSEGSSETEVKIFPNPFEQSATLTFPNSLQENITITLHDMQGKLVWKRENINAAKITLQRDDLKHGMYLLHILQAQSLRYSGKIIVEK
ncbi:MAG TPA: T9SS type A sorting domain-containing protein [Bacteroidetes bacterium]|nr:T9SS type A sorting domain-containing protein [Bacteroidota bacterium]